MNLVFALKLLSDLCYFFFAIASLSTCAPHSGLLLTSPVIVACAAYFSRAACQKHPNRWYLRYAPILLCAACFLFTKETADYVVTIPMVLYLAVVVYQKSYLVDYDTTLSRFYLCLKLLPIPALLLIIASNWRGFQSVMLPYFFFFLVLNVMLLRMLRHNEKVLTDRRFRLMNVGEIAVICGVGYLLSSGYMLTALKYLMGLLVRFVIKPVLMGIVYVFGGFAWVLNKIFGGIDFNLKDVDMSGLDDLGKSMQQNQQAMDAAKNQDSMSSVVFTYVLIGIGALILIAVAILLFRALMRAGRREDDNKFEDVRESLDDPNDPKDPRLTRAPRDRVRHYYRKFLKLCAVRGIGTGENLTSLEIHDQVRPLFKTPSLTSLRALYIKARYSSAEVTPAEVKEAKVAYEEVRKNAE